MKLTAHFHLVLKVKDACSLCPHSMMPKTQGQLLHSTVLGMIMVK